MQVHLSVVMNKLLLLLGRIYLHAGAVSTRGVTSAFAGSKGAGKSTLCLALARAGATLLADDHLVVRRGAGVFMASGCEDVARVTAQTEALLLPGRLTATAQDFGGTLKKEFAVTDWFDARPFEEFELHRLYLTRVGERTAITRLSPRVGLFRLLEWTRSAHRLADTEDHRRHLEFFSALANRVEISELELSPDLNDLDRTIALLGTDDVTA
jgi:hypothetical protein